MLRVTPIYGSRYDPKGAAHTPSCTLVEYGGVRVLVNVGWDEGMSAEHDFPSELPPHEVLVITDSTLGAMGALPLYYQQPNRRRMYATFPTVKMGQMTLYDHHASLSLDGRTPPYTLEQIDEASTQLQTLKYSQSLTVSDPLTDQPALDITAHRAGHVVGGAFYVMQRLQDETEVVVTRTYHIAKELHLDSATLLKHGSTPDVLVTRPGGPAMGMLSKLYSAGADGGSKPLLPPPLVSQSEKALVETILAVLRRDGNVLLPVDASGRVLELLLLLNQHWDRHRLSGAYNLCWVGPMTTNTIEYARSQLEWMAAPLGHQFDSQRGHPFAFNNIHICSSLNELDAVISSSNGNPTAVLASGLSLDCGPARDLLLRWYDNPDHAIVLTDSSRCILRPTTAAAKVPAAADTTKTTSTEEAATTAATTATTPIVGPDVVPGDEDDAETAMVGSAMAPSQVSEYCTAAQLLLKWCEAKLAQREMEDVVEIDVRVPHRAPLAGAELKTFLAQEEAARQEKKEKEELRAMLQEVELAKGRLRLGEPDAATGATQSSSEPPSKSSGTPKSSDVTKTSKIGATRPKKKSRFDSSLFLKFSKPNHLTFEYVEEAVGVGQTDSTAKYGIGESVGKAGEVLEDDYGIAVDPDRFVDIVTGVDPAKFAGGSGRIGEEVLRRGLGFGVDGRPVMASKSGGGPTGGATGRTAATEGDDGLEDEMDEQALEAADLSEGTGTIRGRNGRPPIKVTTGPRRLEVLAEFAYVPLEGRVDARAARQSVRALQPRQVVILGGSGDDDDMTQDKEAPNEVVALADAVRSHITDGEQGVFTPSDGETVELNVGHAAYSVRLLDTPYQRPEDKEAAAANDSPPPQPLEPFEAQLGECTISVLDSVATGQKVALDGSIVMAPRAISSKEHTQPSIMISDGDVLLTDLRTEVIAQGMKAEYSAHSGYSQLVVNGKIVVKKDQDTGKMSVEGPCCEDFFAVRSVVCGQFCTL